MNLSSSILVGPAFVSELLDPADVPLWFDNPFERVYELGSNIDRLGGCDAVLEIGETVGGGGGADGLETGVLGGGNGIDAGG